jgi:hypothetical protein
MTLQEQSSPEKLEPSDGEQLLGKVPNDGTSVGNTTLRTRLGWEKTRYFDAQKLLVQSGLISLGRGKGGSVSKVIAPDVESSVLETTQDIVQRTETEAQRELGLYEPLRKGLELWFDHQRQFEFLHVEVTGSKGSRDTGGKWTRPDLTAVAVQVFELLSTKHLSVVTFEVKADPGQEGTVDISGVFEALAHSRGATESFLIIHIPDGKPERRKGWNRVRDECTRVGIGLITFDSPEDDETFEVHVDARLRTPNPADMSGFLMLQLSEPGKNKLRTSLR